MESLRVERAGSVKPVLRGSLHPGLLAALLQGTLFITVFIQQVWDQFS